MEFAPGGYLPFDGGDESPRQTQRSPYDFRVSPWNQAYTSAAYTGQVWKGTFEGVSSVESRQSYNHPVAYLGRSQRNIGGKFVHTKMHVDKFGDVLNPSQDGTTWRTITGCFAPSGSFRSRTQVLADSYVSAQNAVTSQHPLVASNDLDARGTTAIARVAPTNPLVDLSSGVAELMREGLPQDPREAGNIGGQYLNIMFGYVPLYGDVTSTVDVARRSDALLQQYERDSGRWIRRHYEFEPQTEFFQSENPSAVPALYGEGTGGLARVGTLTSTRTVNTRIWFDGAFTYYLPRKGWRRSVAELDHLYGIRPGIDTLWELTGYSWLVDYFSNVGDVMKNITAFKQDGLVMPYGYVMAKRITTIEENWTGEMRFGSQWKRVNISGKISYISHQRRLANPFGFGLEMDGLTGRQLSILAALGIANLQR